MLQVRDLRKSYGPQRALDGVTFSVERGETVVVMGPSGCGKSTLLKCISRLCAVDAGEILFEGRRVNDLQGAELLAYRRKVGFVFQQFNLVAHLSALENVMLGLVGAGTSRELACEIGLAALDRVGLRARAGARPDALSGGEQQRVAIARTLALDPELILWDEPTASLDPIMVEEVMAIMVELSADERRSMIVVTHEIPFALAMADRAVLMDRGRVAAYGTPEEALLEADCEVGRRFRRLYRLRHAGHFGEVRAGAGRNGAETPRSVQGQPYGEVTRS